MPIDTPYNRMIADQYNAMNRAKVAYLDNNNLETVGSPAGYATTGYEPRRVGSGVGMYNKTAECPKGHEVCNCGMGNARGAGKARGNARGNARGGNNTGLDPNVRASLALGAGLKATTTQRHGTLNQKQMSNAMSAMTSLGSGEAHGISATHCGRGNARGNARGKARGPARGKAQGGDLKDWWEKGKKAVEVGKQIYDVGKKAYDVGKEGYDLYKKVRGNGGTGGYVPTQQQYHAERHRGRVAHGEAHGEAHGKKVNKRAVVVKKIMKEKGLSMIEASKYVKAHNLY